ncbi:EamA family transporter RarD [Solemya elarraichensis gill symbiont]|uniref:Chemotaxis protein n=1 Tax=Solemya elarraichensis gill symbiont TaxID=1918949 RepID=A0A1T2LBR6_9GAMM|nr:EamA family transporter RarD [Solemya elarraichensis gill symbiont]OOZ42452.1 hypothetical protein BOW52_03185 [Solemya elarraichensis gill symbiont]
MIKGVSFSLIASVLFGVMYYYATLLAPLTGEQIFGWRMLLTVPIMTGFMLAWGQWNQIRDVARRLLNEARLWVILPLSSALLGVQLWLFMWAPLHNMALDASIGYFLLPMTMLVAGRLIYKDKLSGLQKIAALCALFGVSHELYRVGVFSWASLLVALGYPLYFILRRKEKLDCLGGLWFDLALTLPVALWFAIREIDSLPLLFTERPTLYILIPILGLISSLALASYIAASRLLNLSLFGLLGYVEPVLLAIVALLLGEHIGSDQWLTYIPIWLAVGLLAVAGIRKLHELRETVYRDN